MVNWIKQKWFPLTVGLLLATRLLHMEPWMDSFYAQRQADAAQYALDFHQNGIDLLDPKVCWLGDHASLILEFPLHEAMTAGFYNVFGYNLVWSRMVTFAFYVMAVVYLYLLLIPLIARERARIATIVYLVLPLGLVFSRSVHADIAAIGLAHAAVFHALAIMQRRSPAMHLVLLALTATLSALIKIPYLFYFALPLGVYLLQNWHTKTAISLVAAAVVPAGCFLLWRSHVFAVNNLAPDWFWIPGYYKFTHMNSWYFGALEMRFDLANWWVLAKRLATDIATPFGLIFMLIGLSTRSASRAVLFAWLAGTLVYVLVFFRLNVIHHYYQNPTLSIVAVFIALGIWRVFESRRKLLPIALLAIALPAFAWAERFYYHRNVYAEQIGQRVAEHSAAADLVVIAYPSTAWCDPRMLYAAQRKGWALQTGALTPENLAHYKKEGAKLIAIFIKQDEPLSAPLRQALAAYPKFVYDIGWDKQALEVYRLDKAHTPR